MAVAFVCAIEGTNTGNTTHAEVAFLGTAASVLIVVSEDAAGDTVGHTMDVAVDHRPRRNWLG